MIKCLRINLLSILFGCSVLFPVCVSAENLIALKIGMSWPSAVVKENSRIRLAGDAGLEYGMMFDKKFGLGFAGDFFWNRVGDEKVDTTPAGNPQYQLLRERKSFMFPLGAFVIIDPMTNWIVHPAAKFQIGYNSLVYGLKDSIHNELDYYFGLYIRAGLEAVYNMGESTAIFAGADYQWANPRTIADKDNSYKRKDMSGLGIHIGFRAIY